MKMDILRFVFDFLKVGVIGFGGGSALIPVVEREVVTNRALLSDEEFLKHAVVANITPGALPVKLAATCGMQLHGAAASFLAALAVAAPGVLATVVLVYLFSTLDGRAMDVLNHAGMGVTVFIAFLLCHYVLKTIRAGNARVNAAICLLAFLATGGKEAREFAGLAFGLASHHLGTPLFNISMIHLMIVALYCIALFQLISATGPRLAGCAAALAYAAARGDACRAAFPVAADAVSVALAAFFLVSLAYLHWKERSRGGAGGKTGTAIGIRPEIVRLLWFFPGISLLPVLLGWMLGPAAGIGGYCNFFADILLSTVTSFGGGEAYVSVADSVFVQGGAVDAAVFYNRIVPAANALPGPILVKIAAATGFVWGMENGGTALAIASSAACFLLPVGACSGIALLVLNFYDILRESAFVLALKRYILPVICGSLLSTSLAIFCESAKIGAQYSYPPRTTLAAMAAGVLAIFLVQRRRRLHDLILLGACLGGGMLIVAVSG